MNWEETVCMIRKLPEFSDLVFQSYLSDNLKENQRRFRASEEYAETLSYIRQYTSGKELCILDVGAGNGIASISFALDGFQVAAVEPDTSHTVGAGAIEQLKKDYGLTNVRIMSCYAEELPFKDRTFDLVYARQTMHHAKDLNRFIMEVGRVLKEKGVYFSARDHVIYDRTDKAEFLHRHPLHRFYQGENAYTLKQYRKAMAKARLNIALELSHFMSVINYYPATKESLKTMQHNRQKMIADLIRKKISPRFAHSKILRRILGSVVDMRLGRVFNERAIPGRLYTFIAVKK